MNEDYMADVYDKYFKFMAEEFLRMDSPWMIGHIPQPAVDELERMHSLESPK